jgi:signal transduction histidine kinase
MRHRLLGLKLRTKIIAWSFVPTAMVLLLVALTTYYAYQQVTAEMVINSDQELARLSASELSSAFQDYIDRLNTLSRRSAIYLGVPQEQQAVLSSVKNQLVFFDAGVYLLDNLGKVTATLPEQTNVVGQDWSDTLEFKNMVLSPSVLLSNIEDIGPHQQNVIVIAVPVLDEQSEFKGVALGMFRLDATAVSPFYGSIIKLRLGENGNAYIVDGNLRVIYASNSSQYGWLFNLYPEYSQMLAGKDGAVRTNSSDGRDVVAGFAPVPRTNWTLVIEENWSDLVSPGQGYRRFLGLLLVLGVLIPTTVVMFGVRRITGPVSNFIAAAQRIAGGDFSQSITVKSGDELEELADQFNVMAGRLQESYETLEMRVEQRTHELTALNSVAAIASRSLDLEKMLPEALAKTIEVMGMDGGSIHRLEPEIGMLVMIAHLGLNNQLVAYLEHSPLETSIVARVVETGEPVAWLVSDFPPGPLRTAIENDGWRVVVSIPLISQEKVLGAINLASRTLGKPAPESLAVPSAIGQQIGVAIENARLYASEQRRAEQFRLINEVSHRFTLTLDINELLNQVASLIQTTFQYYHIGIGLIEGDEVVYRVGAGVLWDDPQFQFKPGRLKLDEQSLTGWVANHGKAIMIPDVSRDPRYIWMLGSKTRSELIVPIISKGQILGVLDVQSDRLNAFDQRDLIIMQSLANQAGGAVENARLYAQTVDYAHQMEAARQASETARAAAEAANVSKSTFLANVSHELRTPLVSILGFARLVQKRLVERIFPLLPTENGKASRAAKQVDENLAIILMEGHRLTQLINDLLDLEKIEAGKMEWHIQPLDIGDVIQQAVNATAPLFADKPLKIVQDVAVSLPLINGDRDKLLQVVINLISNAAKFTSQGVVTVRAAQMQDQVIVSVIDQGIGIAPADQARVFEKFTQVGDTLTEKPSGSGLGLSISREIVEHHNGRIWVESEVGKGSTFSFTLPITTSPDRAGEAVRTGNVA